MTFLKNRTTFFDTGIWQYMNKSYKNNLKIL